MIFALTYQISGLFGPGGYLSQEVSEVANVAKSLAVAALDQLDDAVGELEWFDLDGAEANPYIALEGSDSEQILHMVSQVNDYIAGKGLGHLSFFEYESLGELLDDQQVLNWCSERVKRAVSEWKRAESDVVKELAAAWNSI